MHEDLSALELEVLREIRDRFDRGDGAWEDSLAQSLGIGRPLKPDPRVVEACRSLENRGYIERDPAYAPAPGRSRYYRPTAKGRKVLRCSEETERDDEHRDLEEE